MDRVRYGRRGWGGGEGGLILSIFKKRVPVFLIIRFIELLIKLVTCHAFPYKSHLLDEQKKQ